MINNNVYIFNITNKQQIKQKEQQQHKKLKHIKIKRKIITSLN